MDQQRLVGCGCFNVSMAATCSQTSFPSVPASKSKAYSERYDKACNTGSMLTEWQAGKHPLPSATAFLWSHLLCKIAVLFTRNCYQRRGQKNDHMHWAADLCFLYLHVSQNNALYRNTEKRPLQTSSRTEGFVSRLHMKVGWTPFSCRNAARHSVL